MSKKRHIEILVRGVCVVDGLLLLCHTKGADNTYLPGGHVEFGESAPEALVREIQEELGLSSRAGCFMGAVEHEFVQQEKPHHEINLVFALAIDGVSVSEPPASQEDYIEFRWHAMDDLERSALEPSTLRTSLKGWTKDNRNAWASTIR